MSVLFSQEILQAGAVKGLNRSLWTNRISGRCCTACFTNKNLKQNDCYWTFLCLLREQCMSKVQYNWQLQKPHYHANTFLFNRNKHSSCPKFNTIGNCKSRTITQTHFFFNRNKQSVWEALTVCIFCCSIERIRVIIIKLYKCDVARKTPGGEGCQIIMFRTKSE